MLSKIASPYNVASDLRRREFLKKMGLGSAACMLSSFIPTMNVSGAECPNAKRLIIFYTGDGTNGNDWKPTGTGTNFQLSNVHEALNPYKNDLSVIVGMRNSRGGPGDGHIQAGASMWTASMSTDAPNGLPDSVVKDPDGNGRGYFATTRSIDQEIANSLECFGSTSRRSYHMGINIGAEKTKTRVFQLGNRVPVYVETKIDGIMNDLFPAGVGGTSTTHRAKIFDGTLFELESIKARAPVEDRAKFDQHISALRMSQARLPTTPSTLACERPNIGPTDNFSNLTHDNQFKIMMPLAISAMACDRTRVMCFQLNHTQNDSDDVDKQPLRLAGDGTKYGAFNGFYHSDAHGGSTTNVDRFYASMFALLIQKLKDVPEGNGSMLDNSLVVWSRDLDSGSGHTDGPVNTVIAGSAGGQIQTGRVINVGNEPNAKLFVSMGRLMGLNNFNSFGNINPNSGPLVPFFS